jgi:hypothetical protein
VACPSPIAYHCGSMVGGAVLSLMHWSNAPATSDPVRRGSSSDSLTQGMMDDVPFAVCWQRRELRPSRCRGRTVVGGSVGANPEATVTPKWIAEARREQLVLYTDSEATGA